MIDIYFVSKVRIEEQMSGGRMVTEEKQVVMMVVKMVVMMVVKLVVKLVVTTSMMICSKVQSEALATGNTELVVELEEGEEGV